MIERKAQCSCGDLRVEVVGEPTRISVCHCLTCQRRSGSAFAVQARFPPERVKRFGKGTDYVRLGDSGTAVRFTFCPRCGATVWYQIEDEASIAIPVGAFADPGFPAPTVSVYEERQHAWVTLPSIIEHFD